MRYLTGVVNESIAAHAATELDLGVMLQPASALWPWVPRFSGGHAYDNGAFGAFLRGEPFDPTRWRKGLTRVPAGALFAVVPDVVGDHHATRAAWGAFVPEVLDAGLPPAFVLQNGCVDFDQVPYNAAAVFIGGDDAYKLGPDAARVCWQARAAGRWVHMGRVNSAARWTRALAMGCDSADGTFLRFGPPADMLARLDAWLRQGRQLGGQLDVLDHAGASL